MDELVRLCSSGPCVQAGQWTRGPSTTPWAPLIMYTTLVPWALPTSHPAAEPASCCGILVARRLGDA